MDLLVIGSGGREHAIAKKLKESSKVNHVYCAPGNIGMKRDGIEPIAISENDFDTLIKFAKENKIEFTFVGPENPLINGIASAFISSNLKIFGPEKAAAMMEGSKEFAKQIMEKYNVPTAKYKKFTNLEEAKEYISKEGAPIVIKADGLAAGKGVVVATTTEEAINAATEMLEENKFGEASSKIIVEEFLEGEEFSLMSFVYKDKFYPMVIAQDHKRALDGDKGPNTGGMGAYAPVKQISEDLIQNAIKNIVEPTVNGLVQEKIPFVGVLYAGLIATSEGPKVIEFNARFGDPETQVILDRLKTDLAEFISKLLNEEEVEELKWESEGVTLGVVLASKGYPESYEKYKALVGLDELNSDTNIFFAGVAEKDEKLVSNGGRVLLISVRAEDMKKAQEKIYLEMKKIETDDFFYRKDIGYQSL